MSRVSDPDVLRQWSERLAQFQQTPQTIGQFCRSIGCSVATFYFWKRKVERGKPSKTETKPETKPIQKLSQASMEPETIETKPGVD
jgi:transposase-like protein